MFRLWTVSSSSTPLRLEQLSCSATCGLPAFLQAVICLCLEGGANHDDVEEPERDKSNSGQDDLAGNPDVQPDVPPARSRTAGVVPGCRPEGNEAAEDKNADNHGIAGKDKVVHPY